MDKPVDHRALRQSRALKRLRALATKRGVDLAPAALDALCRYAEALADVGRTINLSAAKSFDEVLEVLVGPSLPLADVWPDQAPPTRVVDIGSGNGFPGVVAKVLWPDADVCLVERRGRKAEAIRSCLDRASIDARVFACDARELPREAPDLLGTTSLVTARGVGQLDGVNRLAAPLLAAGGVVVHWKAFDLSPEERETARAGLRAFGLELVADVAFAPGPPGPGRLLCYRRRV